MDVKIIKSDKQHRQYLAEAESLAAADARLGTAEMPGTGRGGIRMGMGGKSIA